MISQEGYGVERVWRGAGKGGEQEKMSDAKGSIL